MATDIVEMDFNNCSDQELIRWFEMNKNDNIDLCSFLLELKKRNIDFDPLVYLKGFFADEIKLVNGTLWDTSQKGATISMVYPSYRKVRKMIDFLNSLDEIKGKKWITFDYIHSQLYNETSGCNTNLSDVDYDIKKVKSKQVFFYYQHKDKIYPKLIPFKSSKPGYYVVFKRNSYDRGIHSITLYNHKNERVKYLEMNSYVELEFLF